MQQKKDFIIVGQGLAGTVLSEMLIQRGHSVHVFDHFKENSATRIAAGVFNPVAYRKLKMAEFAHVLLPEIYRYFPRLEELLGVSFFKPMSFLKLLTDVEELNNWQAQSGEPINAPFMSKDIFTDNFEGAIKNPFGAGQVLQSGVLNLGVMLNAWQKHLIELDSFSEQVFDYNQLELDDEGLIYENMKAKKIIFCEGVGVLSNPWFDWLPMQRFKGEVLEISAPKLKLNRMINRGIFLLPLANGNFKVGATHDWKHVDEQITEEGKLNLTEKLDKIINVPYEIVRHYAGLRPSARDRHPYIGVHPQNKNMFVINGLGSKGVIMAPWLIKTFINGIENKEWPKQFDIKRYHRFYEEKLNNEKN